MNGVAITTSSEVVKFAQTSNGMRQNVIPGARMVMIVTRKLSAVRIDDAPAHWTPMLKNMLPTGESRRERGVAGPAGGERAARGEEAGEEHHPRDRQQPVRERVQTRERHVRRAEHERHDEVREPGERRDDEEEDHQRGVHRDEAVEGLRVDELQPRLRQLGAEDHRHQPADDEEDERRGDVLDADHLVVGVDTEVVPPAVGAVARSGPRARVGRPEM